MKAKHKKEFVTKLINLVDEYQLEIGQRFISEFLLSLSLVKMRDYIREDDKIDKQIYLDCRKSTYKEEIDLMYEAFLNEKANNETTSKKKSSKKNKNHNK